MKEAPIPYISPEPVRATPTEQTIFTVNNERHRQVLEAMNRAYVEACTDEGFMRFIEVVSKLWHYSENNQALIFAQRPNASMVMGYGNKEGTTGWKSIGRQVKKGENAIKILAPQKRWVTKMDDVTGEEVRYQVTTGFRIVNVFDVSQTEGEPIPEPPTASERFGTSEVTRLLDRKASLWGIGQGLCMEKGDTGRARGTFNPLTRTLRLSETLPDNDGKFKTLVHELAHFAAGHQPVWEHKARNEVEAEGIAGATLLALGLDTTSYSANYMAMHGRTPDVMREAMPTIAKTTRTLVEAIEGERPDGESEWL